MLSKDFDNGPYQKKKTTTKRKEGRKKMTFPTRKPSLRIVVHSQALSVPGALVSP